MLGTAVALGAGILLAPNAVAADKWGPGYLIPDSTGKPDTSHIGAYGAPGHTLPGVDGLAYCADPELAGPDAASGYGPARPTSTWTSKATGKTASAEDVARAAYVLGKYGQTTSDEQAAAVDAVVYTYLEAGSTYALPNGKRALERLGYPNVSPDAKKWATGYLNEAQLFAGPYKINIKPVDRPLKAGVKASVTLDVTAASGRKVPGIQLDLDVSGAAAGAASVTTNADGVATATITPAKDGTVDFKALAKSLPATQLRALTPNDPKAQRLLLAGGSSSAEARVQLTAEGLKGGLTVTKTASDTKKPLAGVEFDVKDTSGKTVASGKTDAEGIWKVTDLAPGTYTVHEAKAVEGYQLAADQKASVADGKTVSVAVTDTKIPEQPKPKPRPVTIPVLPQTGA
ncbi:MSCRAMM family protein [Streptomyces sp. NBC_01264]|uniref:MSCRAMM family protein n=1 Tax=Streptomyces sp. NBC_01264 TaxID=2903804 RepID=UPI0022593916|nr:SpaA isopeptide-forming pilin-related protein [Streptomyces sp. NBC_01264]MCX4783952.1 SpaA isopeptide-forming pilin-related protein [Streptomyces sp. NBC_01264]